MKFFKKHFIFCFFLIIIACTSSLQKTPPPFINVIWKKNQTPTSFFLYGDLKIKRSGYGWVGKIQIIKTLAALRLDILTSLDWPLLTAIVKEKQVKILSYNEGKVYIGEKLPKGIKTWLPAGLNLDVWTTILGKQLWLIDYGRYTYKKKQDVFLLSFIDKKSSLKEELWLRRKDLKVKKIVLKNRMEDTLWTACFSYNNQGQILFAQIKDKLGTHIEVNYETLDLNPTITPKVFELNLVNAYIR